MAVFAAMLRLFFSGMRFRTVIYTLGIYIKKNICYN